MGLGCGSVWGCGCGLWRGTLLPGTRYVAQAERHGECGLRCSCYQHCYDMEARGGWNGGAQERLEIGANQRSGGYAVGYQSSKRAKSAAYIRLSCHLASYRCLRGVKPTVVSAASTEAELRV